MASYNKSLRTHKQRRYTKEAAYLVYSSYIAALGEKLRRARQGMFPCQALRSFSFWLQKRTPGSAGGRKKPMARGGVDKKKSPS